jgi:predicted NAD-dependent protein-ADP-ribosyltransferase YbiA (DUF1768 family)
MRLFWPVFAILLLLALHNEALAQCTLVDDGHDSVFITFERTAGVRVELEDQLQDGVLFRLHNNSSCPIFIRTGSLDSFYKPLPKNPTVIDILRRKVDDTPLPDGALVPEVQYTYRSRGVTSRSVGGDNFFSVTVLGAQTMLFEVPVKHLEFRYFAPLEIKFEYAWESQHTKARYGSVEHIVRFSIPDDVRKDLASHRPSKKGALFPPAKWFGAINDPKKPDWEILPQEAKAGEVILSKRNELGILSNFAATPFELDGKRYASVEGFWQMMLYPEGPDDERAKANGVDWKFTREQVAQMTAFEAKSAGTLAEENMKKLGIDWVTHNGKRFPYRSATPGEHYRLILTAMRAKFNQNPEVKRILLATGDLILKPDHHGEDNPPPEWKYYDIWMQLRSELQKPHR